MNIYVSETVFTKKIVVAGNYNEMIAILKKSDYIYKGYGLNIQSGNEGWFFEKSGMDFTFEFYGTIIQ